LKKEQRNKEIIKGFNLVEKKELKIKRERDEKGRFKKADEPTTPTTPSTGTTPTTVHTKNLVQHP
jgi:hypothetical protein